MAGDKITVLTSAARAALRELSPASNDPLLSEVWALCVSTANEAGARLLERRHGCLVAAASEVRIYVSHLERVEGILIGSPFIVPRVAAHQLRSARRYVSDTLDSGQLVAFLFDVPVLAAAFTEYLLRVEGDRSRPVIDVLDLAVRAGDVFADCLLRTIPPGVIAKR